LRYKPAIKSLGLARRGDATELRALLERAPDVLASAPHAAALLHLAALGGRIAVVELLLRSGVDVNKPSPIESLIFVTPLCAARAKRRKEIEELLIRHDAKEDIFTHAFLGDIERLRGGLLCEPSWSQAVDPAVDVLDITPIHHAVAGARVEALRVLLSHTSQATGPLLGGARAVREAAARAKAAGATRFCMGAAYRAPKAKDIAIISEMIREVRAAGLETCATLGMLKPDQAQQLKEAGLDPGAWSGVTLMEGAGCLECSGTGYHGRTAICELLDLTDRIREMIVDRRPTSEIKRIARDEGMITLRESGLAKIRDGVTSVKEINKVTFVE